MLDDPAPDVAAQTASAPTVPPNVPDPFDGEWQRLDLRVVWANAGKFVVSLIPTIFGLVVLGPEDDLFGWWPALLATAFGILSSVNDVRRWWLTRFRITDTRIELQVGRLVRKHRSVPRDRVRTVNTSARLRHRVAGLRIVNIGTGEHGMAIELDALRIEAAAEIRRVLLHHHDAALTGVGSANPESASAGADTDADADSDSDSGSGSDSAMVDQPPVVLSRFRLHWVFYNMISIWGFLVGILMLWSAYWSMRVFHVNLLDVWDDLVGWRSLPVWKALVVSAPLPLLVGIIVLSVQFVTTTWNFRLTLEQTSRGPMLVSRQGMFKTNEVFRDMSRIRGIQVSQPLLWRWMGLCETKVISTGLGGWTSEAANILPRCPVSEARAVAPQVLSEGRPLEVPLRRHPRSALVRRLCWAVLVPAVASGALLVYRTSGALPDGIAWPLPLLLTPLTIVFAVVAYRSLGHQIDGPYLVMRLGVSRCTVNVLDRRAIVGWKFHRAPLQRLFGLMTATATTAAGERFYELPDVSPRQGPSLAAALNSWSGEFVKADSSGPD